MIKQTPGAFLPLTDPAWQQWFAEVAATGAALQYIDPTNPQFGKVVPQNPSVGMLIYADGVNAKPSGGTKAGFYRWTGSAWSYIG
jgi:hypothetical protein